MLSPTALSSLPVALPLAGRPVLVVGGEREAEDKTHKLLAAGAVVTVVAPQVSAVLQGLAKQRRIAWFARAFQPSDAHNAHIVMLTFQDEELARELVTLRARARFWLCAIDQPAYSDIHLVSTLVRGPVQIGISTGGSAPLLARVLRQALEAGLDQRFAAFAHKVAELRRQLRSAPKQERTVRLEQALNGFAMDVRLSYPAEEGASGAGTELAK